MTAKVNLPPKAEEILEGVAENEGPKPKQADILIALGRKAVLFHSPAPEREAFAHLQVADHFETLRVRGEFRKWLRHAYFEATGQGCNSEAMQIAVETLASIAEFSGEEREVSTRIAEHHGAIYIDIGDASWRAIEVTASGWKVIDAPPVHFRRSASTRPLPLPQGGGSIKDLRPFVNAKSDTDFVLLVSYIAAALRPRANYPILVVTGQQGSAKTWTACLVVRFVDPREPDRRSMPREEDNLIVAAKTAHLPSFDNLSRLAAEISDALCRLSTGGGAGKRRLYSDDDEVLFSGKRPIVLNGITDFATSADLLDRVVFLTLEPITDTARRDERELGDEIAAAAPKIFGALLDGLVAGLREVDRISIPDKPRMADFALWGEACSRAWWPAGTFIKAYRQNRASAVELSIEASPVASAVRSFMRDRTNWSGTAEQLLKVLSEKVSEQTARAKSWPTLPRELGGELRRAAPNLAKVGIAIAWDKGRHYGRLIHISKTNGTDPDHRPNLASPASPASPPGVERDGGDDGDGVLSTQAVEARSPAAEPTCHRCGVPGNATHGQLIRAGRDGAAGHYHPRCWTEERTKGPRRRGSPDRRPALGPEG